MRTRFDLLIFALFAIAAAPAWADTVDDFTAAQGPITVGPDELPPESEATGLYPNVLGGFRVMAPVVGEDSAPASTATARIGGGEFECVVDLPSMGTENDGGCAVAWPGAEQGQTFDLTNAGAFEFEVLEAGAGALVAITLVEGDVDINSVFNGDVTTGVIGFIESPTPGSYTLPINQFFNPTDPFGQFDLTSVTSIVLVAGYFDGVDGTVRIGAVSTTGPVDDGPVVNPPDDPDDPPPDEELITFVSGTYYNPARSGEGCQVTLEGDGVTIILTCYIFQDGAQAWIIGAGTLSNGQVTFDMTLTSGGDFGNDFNPDDVVRTPWGTAIMRWSDCNNAEIQLNTLLLDYPPITLETTKVTQSDCAGAGAPEAALRNQGTLYDPARSGEGFQLAVQGESGIFVLTWYTYLDGEQVWIIGTGTQAGNQLVFDDLVITSGGDFGADFNPDNVVRTFWGSIIFLFTDCNNAIALITPDPLGQPEFVQFEMQVRKLVLGTCPTP